MAGRAQRFGFTLIELLSVAAVITVLVSICVPAVQQARESSRQLQCRNNLKQFGLALHQYVDIHRVLPRLCFEGKGPTSTYVTGWQGFSAHSMLLPYLEQAALYQQIDFNSSFPAGLNATTKNTVVPVFLCPSDRGGRPVKGAGNNYVVSGGPSLMMISPIPGKGVGGTPGIAISPADQIGAFNMRRTVSLRDISDGLSNTIAASEALIGDGESNVYSSGDLVRATPFPPGFPNTFAGSSQLKAYAAACSAQAATHYSDPHKEWINGMPAQTAFNTLNPPNSTAPDCHENSASGWYDSRGVWTARSNHHGGVNVLLADGACRTFGNSIDLQTWQFMGAIDDGQVIASF